MSHAADNPSQRSDRPPPDAESLDAAADDPRLLRAMQEYLRELESGRQPDRRQWLDRYPDLAEALNQCLDGLEFVHQAAPLASPLSAHAPRVAENVDNLLSANPLGDFQIVREIGRGGMGIVYEAIQLSLGRHVAMKVLPFAATFDAKHLQRFRQEAQAAAQLHHTNIVPVYAVGCERGIHFYAMQLIEGQSLDVVVQQLRQQAGMSPLEVTSTDTSLSSRRGELQRTPVRSLRQAAGYQHRRPVQWLARRTTDTSRANAAPSTVSAPFSTYRTGKEPRYSARSRDVWPRPPKPWNMPISRASFIATSSRRTC